MATANPFDPKNSSVTVEYIGNKDNNLFYWTTQFPWVPAYPGGQTTTELSPKGVIKYTDGTSPTAP
jgi:hypothetical protein